MERQEIINEIKKAVDINSKKGNLTTTKFVGTYEYKSGYDTYIAVSYDLKNKLVVYSFYQNDRGEHIDTYDYDIEKLSEKELNEVFENLNTTDEDIINYIEYIHLDDKNQDIIAKLGLYKPKKKKEVIYDIDSIPELENENDAYYVERNGHIGIMKFVAKESEKLYIHPSIYYHKDNENRVREFYVGDKVKTFDCTLKSIKNDSLFTILSEYEDYSNYKCAFVKSKETLINAINDSKKLGLLYLVGYKGEDTLDCRLSKRGKHDAPKNFKSFSDEEEAIEYYNNLLDATKVVVKELLKEYEACLEALISIFKGNKDDFFRKHVIEAENIKVGKYLLISREYYRNEYKVVGREVNVVKKDENFAYLDDMTVLRNSSCLMNEKDFKKYKKLSDDETNEKVRRCIYNVKETIERLKKFLSRKHAKDFNKDFIYSARGIDINELKNKLNKYYNAVK